MQHYDLQGLIAQQERDEPIEFCFFWGHKNSARLAAGKFCFSQWYLSPFVVDGVSFATAEHWMMAEKAKLFNDEAIFEQILTAPTPNEAKILGRKVRNYDDAVWNAHKFEIVKTGNIHKFSQHDAMRFFLLSTKQQVIVEASPYDRIWGIGMSQDDPRATLARTWDGENLLGFALMEVRDLLNEQ
jgi:ribA/ribD-fused uncharacterized protein